MVVELVGPAGAGKSTLAQNVHRADSNVHVGLSIWGLPRRRLVSGAIALVPTVIVAAVRKRRLRWREIAQMIRLDALRRTLRRAKKAGKRGGTTILLDEGPVFAISSLDLAIAQRGGKVPDKWRRRAIARWARLLDTVILIDAPDTKLADRIRTRAKQHRMAKRSDVAIQRFAKGFRNAFARVIGDLARIDESQLIVDRIRTDGRLDRSAERLRATLARHRNGH